MLSLYLTGTINSMIHTPCETCSINQSQISFSLDTNLLVGRHFWMLFDNYLKFVQQSVHKSFGKFRVIRTQKDTQFLVIMTKYQSYYFLCDLSYFFRYLRHKLHQLNSNSDSYTGLLCDIGSGSWMGQARLLQTKGKGVYKTSISKIARVMLGI